MAQTVSLLMIGRGSLLIHEAGTCPYDFTEKDKIADQACVISAVPREIMTTLKDVEQRPGAAFAYGLKNKRGEPLRSPRKSKAFFSEKETLWGYKDTKVEHKRFLQFH